MSGVKAAFLDRDTHVEDADDQVAGEGATNSSRTSAQDPANLSAQLMMHADQITQKGDGKVVAVIDTGVDMTHPAFTGALGGTPALSADKVASLTPPSWATERPAPTCRKSSPSPTTTRITTRTPRRAAKPDHTARTSPVSPLEMRVKSLASRPTHRSSSPRSRAVATAVFRTRRCSPPSTTW